MIMPLSADIDESGPESDATDLRQKSRKRRRTVQAPHNPSSSPSRQPISDDDDSHINIDMTKFDQHLDTVLLILSAAIQDLPDRRQFKLRERIVHEYINWRGDHMDMMNVNAQLQRDHVQLQHQYHNLHGKYRRLKSLVGYFGQHLTSLGDCEARESSSEGEYIPYRPLNSESMVGSDDETV
ncbi:hypothetical protein H0H92_004981 [Tricholoma furcatifolium]|nr:hypothetical protein H0H92_004981 [Tricholoma furcatifolium]